MGHPRGPWGLVLPPAARRTKREKGKKIKEKEREKKKNKGEKKDEVRESEWGGTICSAKNCVSHLIKKLVIGYTSRLPQIL